MPFDSIRELGQQPELLADPNEVKATTFDSIREVPTGLLTSGRDQVLDWDKVVDSNPVIDPTDIPQEVSPGMRLARYSMRKLKEGWQRDAGAMIGATAASIGIPAAVTAMAGPAGGVAARFGMLALRTGAAGLGGIAGEYVHAQVDPTKETSWDHLKDVGISQAEQQVVGERLVGPLASKVGRGALGLGKAIGRKTYDIAGKEIPQILQKAPVAVKVPSPEFSTAGKWLQEKGVSLLPSQASQDWWPIFKESMSRSGLGNEQAFKLFEKEQQKRSLAAVDDLMQSLGPLRTWQEGGEVGGDLYTMVKRTAGGSADMFGRAGTKLKQAEALFGPIYDAAEAASKEAMPTTAGLKEYASKLLLENRAIQMESQKGGGFLSAEGEAVLEHVMNLEDRISTRAMRDLKSKWFMQTHQLHRDLDSGEKIVKKLTGLSDEAIFSQELNPNLPKDIKDQLRLANGMFRSHNEMLDRYFPVKVAEKFQEDPEYWFGQLFDKPGTHGGPLTTIRGIREALTKKGMIGDVTNKETGQVVYRGTMDPEGELAWKKIQQASTWAVIHKATREDVINPKVIHDWMADMGPEAISELLGRDGVEALRRTEAAGTLLAKKAQPHPWIVGSATIGAALNVARGLYNGLSGQDYVNFTIGGVLVLGPRTLARIMTKPRTYATLEDLGRLATGSPKYGAMVVRLVRELQDDDDESVREQKAAIAENVKRHNDKEWTASQPTLEQSRSWKGGPRGL